MITDIDQGTTSQLVNSINAWNNWEQMSFIRVGRQMNNMTKGW
jgi:hypothetical protein